MKSPRALIVALVTFATFNDLVAYSIAVPVLPDLATRLGASPTVIGLLFGSFGLTLLAVSIPMGATSDRIGRKRPMLAGLIALAVATLVFAFSRSLAWLFAARLIQGAADAVTWVVGFALIADLYQPEERGRVMGIVLAGTGFGLMIGPPLGGWLYELGGVRLPFLIASAATAVNAIAFAFVTMPPRAADTEPLLLRELLGVPAVVACVAAVVGTAATIAMLEPVLPLRFSSRMGLQPSQIGLLFGLVAVASTLMHPVYGALSDRWGGRPLTIAGLVLAGLLLPVLVIPRTLVGTGVSLLVVWLPLSMTITPSLAFVAEAASSAGHRSYGVVYGLYNVAWAVGLLCGPVVGGFLYERVGFGTLCFLWSPALLGLGAALGNATRRPQVAVQRQNS